MIIVNISYIHVKEEFVFNRLYEYFYDIVLLMFPSSRKKAMLESS